jgi:4-oxalocrotonate tautomerase
MPYVNIKVTREGTTPDRQSVTAEQKAELIKGVSELLLKVLNKPLNATFVVIDQVDKEDWGVGGLPVDVWRKQVSAKR